MRDYECIGTEFCCVVDGKVCQFSVRDVAGRAFACALMLKYDDWDAVIASPEYKPVGDYWEYGHSAEHIRFDYCREFDPAFCCRPEFLKGRRNEAQTVVIG